MQVSQIILVTSLSLLIGCSRPPIEVSEDALFCDLVSENFRYTQEEIDARVASGWTANLRREFEINRHRDRECATDTGGASD